MTMTPGIEQGPPAWEVSARIINQLLSEALWLQNGIRGRFVIFGTFCKTSIFDKRDSLNGVKRKVLVRDLQTRPLTLPR